MIIIHGKTIHRVLGKAHEKIHVKMIRNLKALCTLAPIPSNHYYYYLVHLQLTDSTDRKDVFKFYPTIY